MKLEKNKKKPIETFSKILINKDKMPKNFVSKSRNIKKYINILRNIKKRENVV